MPKGTPKDIVEKLRDATIAAINGPLLKERFAAEGATVVGNSAEALAG